MGDISRTPCLVGIQGEEYDRFSPELAALCREADLINFGAQQFIQELAKMGDQCDMMEHQGGDENNDQVEREIGVGGGVVEGVDIQQEGDDRHDGLDGTENLTHDGNHREGIAATSQINQVAPDEADGSDGAETEGVEYEEEDNILFDERDIDIEEVQVEDDEVEGGTDSVEVVTIGDDSDEGEPYGEQEGGDGEADGEAEGEPDGEAETDESEPEGEESELEGEDGDEGEPEGDDGDEGEPEGEGGDEGEPEVEDGDEGDAVVEDGDECEPVVEDGDECDAEGEAEGEEGEILSEEDGEVDGNCVNEEDEFCGSNGKLEAVVPGNGTTGDKGKMVDGTETVCKGVCDRRNNSRLDKGAKSPRSSGNGQLTGELVSIAKTTTGEHSSGEDPARKNNQRQQLVDEQLALLRKRASDSGFREIQPYGGELVFGFDPYSPDMARGGLWNIFVDAGMKADDPFAICKNATQRKMEVALGRNRITRDAIEGGACIGFGFGTRIYKGKMFNRSIAIKDFVMRDVPAQDILKERDIMICLKDKKFICNIIGSFHEASPYILMELCFGNVEKLVEGIPNKHRDRFAVQLLHGLSWMHSHSIIHTNISTKNCLINSRNNLVISDFGKAVLLEGDRHVFSSTPRGLHFNQDVESNRDQLYSKASDVFSAGLVIFHIEKSYPLINRSLSKDECIRLVIERFPGGTTIVATPRSPIHHENIIAQLTQNSIVEGVLFSMLVCPQVARCDAKTLVQIAINLKPEYENDAALMDDLSGVHYPTFTYSREFTWRKSYKQSDDSDAPLPADKTTTTTTLSTRVATTPPTPSTSAASLVVSPGSTCPRIENRAFLCFYYDEESSLYFDTTTIPPRMDSSDIASFRSEVVSRHCDVALDKLRMDFVSDVRKHMMTIAHNMMTGDFMNTCLSQSVGDVLNTRLDMFRRDIANSLLQSFQPSAAVSHVVAVGTEADEQTARTTPKSVSLPLSFLSKPSAANPANVVREPGKTVVDLATQSSSKKGVVSSRPVKSLVEPPPPKSTAQQPSSSRSLSDGRSGSSRSSKGSIVQSPKPTAASSSNPQATTVKSSAQLDKTIAGPTTSKPATIAGEVPSPSSSFSSKAASSLPSSTAEAATESTKVLEGASLLVPPTVNYSSPMPSSFGDLSGGAAVNVSGQADLGPPSPISFPTSSSGSGSESGSGSSSSSSSPSSLSALSPAIPATGGKVVGQHASGGRQQAGISNVKEGASKDVKESGLKKSENVVLARKPGPLLKSSMTEHNAEKPTNAGSKVSEMNEPLPKTGHAEIVPFVEPLQLPKPPQQKKGAIVLDMLPQIMPVCLTSSQSAKVASEGKSPSPSKPKSPKPPTRRQLSQQPQPPQQQQPQPKQLQKQQQTQSKQPQDQQKQQQNQQQSQQQQNQRQPNQQQTLHQKPSQRDQSAGKTSASLHAILPTTDQLAGKTSAPPPAILPTTDQSAGKTSAPPPAILPTTDQSAGKTSAPPPAILPATNHCQSTSRIPKMKPLAIKKTNTSGERKKTDDPQNSSESPPGSSATSSSLSSQPAKQSKEQKPKSNAVHDEQRKDPVPPVATLPPSTSNKQNDNRNKEGGMESKDTGNKQAIMKPPSSSSSTSTKEPQPASSSDSQKPSSSSSSMPSAPTKSLGLSRKRQRPQQGAIVKPDAAGNVGSGNNTKEPTGKESNERSRKKSASPLPTQSKGTVEPRQKQRKVSPSHPPSSTKGESRKRQKSPSPSPPTSQNEGQSHKRQKRTSASPSPSQALQTQPPPSSSSGSKPKETESTIPSSGGGKWRRCKYCREDSTKTQDEAANKKHQKMCPKNPKNQQL